MRSGVLVLCLWGCTITTYALSWQDLWTTPDKQAEALLNAGQFKNAALKFERQDWQAVAAYRSGDYEQAARLFEAEGDENGFYNQGNALAHLGLYEQALQAYDKVLAINPHHADARFNRKVIDDLLKKDKEKQTEKDKSQSEQKSEGKSDNKDQKDSKNKPSKPKDANNQSKTEADKKAQDKSEDKAQDNSKGKDKGQNKGKTKPKPGDKSKKSAEPSALSREAQEAKQANQQWLRLIPDDPGGLLREKFFRDHLKKQRGW